MHNVGDDPALSERIGAQEYGQDPYGFAKSATTLVWFIERLPGHLGSDGEHSATMALGPDAPPIMGDNEHCSGTS